MTETDFVRCPKCRGQYWCDIPNTVDGARTRFRCERCGYTILLGGCSKCGTKSWSMTKGIEPGGGHRPYYRFRCRTCNRVIGVLIGS